MVAAPVPRAARGSIWGISGMLAISLVAMGLIPIDKVVTARGRVISRIPALVVQPLETSIVRAIAVSEGQQVHAGDTLAELDPTFTEADVGGLASQVSLLGAEVARLQAETEGHLFTYAGSDPNFALQASIAAERSSEWKLKHDMYQQRIDGLNAVIARSAADVKTFQARQRVAEKILSIRKELERREVGSTLDSLAAIDNDLGMTSASSNAAQTEESAQHDLGAVTAERDAYDQDWRAKVSQELSEQREKLIEAKKQLSKAQRRQQLVVLHADRDATVLTVAKVSVGSVLLPGEHFITLVPAGSPLEVEVNIVGHDSGFVHEGAPAAVKFDAFPASQYGLAYGSVRTVSADSFTGSDDDKSGFGTAPVNLGSSEPFYRSRITLDEVKLHDVPPGFHIVPGMPATADIKVGRRTVLAYLLGRILPVASEGMREP
ncbi:HlyD family type I secretion periplasmic adaptor subunit [Mesorhizobium sp. BAC0120]|uniref:HlyD family type I secretion periplasmic adaptor subunit n=1 Tax=Mesorhizobium sp. BAC0120 TaxID=3090670 RepID=UPI00298C1987|nr:HlyD family type I secretion periplasmic adaptor subunit [Mesorhizobium sp. BAC0120]MDW6024168.1 HlyD family type I secretion periplasmic adaptor subunit [Mesorhizobium sp. BAC0120]